MRIIKLLHNFIGVWSGGMRVGVCVYSLPVPLTWFGVTPHYDIDSQFLIYFKLSVLLNFMYIVQLTNEERSREAEKSSQAP